MFGPDPHEPSSTTLLVRFKGEAFKGGEISADDLAESLRGFGEAIRLCNEIINFGQVQTRFSVSAKFVNRSFGFETILSQIVSDAVPIFHPENVKSALETAKLIFGKNGVLSIFQRTKGEPVGKIDHVSNENGVQINAPVSTGGGDLIVNNYFTVPEKAFRCYERPEVRKAFRRGLKAIKAQRKTPTFAEFRVADGDGIAIESSETDYFEEDSEEAAPDRDWLTFNDVLKVLKVSFVRKRTWSFESVSEGVFGARVTDPQFLTRFHSRQEPIDPGDRIVAKIAKRIFADDEPGRPKSGAEYTIVDVYEVIRPLSQISLDFSARSLKDEDRNAEDQALGDEDIEADGFDEDVDDEDADERDEHADE